MYYHLRFVNTMQPEDNWNVIVYGVYSAVPLMLPGLSATDAILG